MLLLLFARYYRNANLFGANWRCTWHLVTYRMRLSPLKIAFITLLLWVSLHRLANDVLKILKAINFDPWVEDLFTDAFNAVGPILMMSIHILVINCLMHNPDVFAERQLRRSSRRIRRLKI